MRSPEPLLVQCDLVESNLARLSAVSCPWDDDMQQTSGKEEQAYMDQVNEDEPPKHLER